MDAIKFITEKQRLCKQFEHTDCNECPIYIFMKNKNLHWSCNEIQDLFPTEIVQLIEQWSKENPPIPTWREWLNQFYEKDDTNKTPDSTFMQWVSHNKIPLELLQFRIEKP